jgi:hypothetical protein
MPRYSSTPRRSALRPRLTLAGLAAGFACLAASPALAQASTCQEIGKKLQALGKAKKGMDPKSACSLFGDLVTNGTTAVKWLEANKDWCQIPDPVVENIKQDHARAVDLRGKACKAAAQQAAMEKKAKEGGSSGLLGGDGLTGSYRMPQGAL